MALIALTGPLLRGGFDGQDIDNTDVSVSVAGQRSGQRPVNGSVSVDRALTEPEDANHLDGNGNPASRQRVNGVNGVANGGDHVCAQCHRDPPDGLEELFPVGRDLVWLHPECRRFYPSPPSKPDGRPALGPPGDRLDDLQ